MRRLVVVPVLVVMLILFGSCGSESQNGENNNQTRTFAHQVSPETEQKVLEDAADDLRVVSAAGSDTDQLSLALTGDALEDTKNTIAQDLAQGRVRKRDYQNINVRVQDFSAPIAQVFAEFDDYGYYVDANTGAALTEPESEHKTFALAMVEEEGRWKIVGIYSPSGTTTATTPSLQQ